MSLSVSRLAAIIGGLVVIGAIVVVMTQTGFLSVSPVNIGIGLPGPTVAPTAVPEPVLATNVGRDFLEAWKQADYDRMYKLLSKESRSSHSRDLFVGRYRSISEGIVLTSLTVESGELTWPSFPNADLSTQASLPFKATMSSARFGDVVQENSLALVRETDGWRVDWKPWLILNGLRDDTVAVVEADNPVRGAILDRKGRVLAGQGSVLSVGLVAGEVKDEDKAFSTLSEYLGIDAKMIQTKYRQAQSGWWVPLRDLPINRLEEASGRLQGIEGVMLQEKSSRVYPENEMASHIIGYVSQVMAEDIEKNSSKGYEDGDFLGRVGIESWAETILAGKKGGKLVIKDGNGEVVQDIAERSAIQGGTVRLTLDIDLQRKAEQILGDRAGSIVLMNVRDNSILAMASRPAFNPNSFAIGMTDDEWKQLSENTLHPFQHRAALSAYPTGSIFKVVTMAAALEEGGFESTSTFHCDGHWTAPGGLSMGCWVTSGHGDVTLFDGLVESCDVVFYEISQALNAKDSNLLSVFARQFGLGKAPGTVGLLESEGTVPDADWKLQTIGQPWYAGDAANLAIGQGYMEATPLQMANLYSALANNGVIRNPVIVASVDDGGEGKRYVAEETGRLPVSQANLQTIREAMVRVTADPKGTAYYAFNGFSIPTAGKTGSAENQDPQAHAWFAGYAPADNPQVVVVAMVEGGEHGAEVAAPLGRQMLEAYFDQQ